MGFKYKQVGVNSLLLNFEGKYSVTAEALGAVNEKAQIIIDTRFWQGESAKSFKQYLSDVYPPIIASFDKALEAIYATIKLYNSGYMDIDGSTSAVVDEAELNQLIVDVDSRAKMMSSISDTAQRTVHSVSDIGRIPYSGITSFENTAKSMVRHLQDLRDAINENETKYLNEANGHLVTLINATLDLINAQQKTDIANYSQAALVESPEYQALAEAYNVVADDIETNVEAIEQATKDRDQLVQTLQEEYEERVRQAEKAKFWVGVACVVASVAVTVATGGAAAPLAGVITGAVTGAVSAGVGSYYDQKIGTLACAGKVSWGKVAGDAFIGGTIGAATSAIGAGFDKWAGGLKSTGMKLFAEKVGIGGLKKAAQGFATDTIQGTYDSGGNILEGLASGFDLRKRASEFGGGCVSTGIKQGMGALEKNDKVQKLFSGKAGEGSVTNDAVLKDPSVLSTLGKSAWHGTIETVAGSGSTFTKTLIAEGDIKKAWNKATDLQTNTQTFLESTASEFMTEELTQLHSKREKDLDKLQKEVDDKVKEQNKKIDKKQDKLEEMGIKRTKNGGVDFSDSDAMVAQTEIELTYDTSSKNIEGDGRPADYEKAYNQLVAEGKIDKNEYVLVKDMNKDQKQAYNADKEAKGVQRGGAIVKTNEDGSMTYYTIHHMDDYDVRTGKSTVQLVETDVHKQTTGHGGSREQIQTTANSDIMKQYQNIGKTGQKQAIDNSKISSGSFDRDKKARNDEAVKSYNFDTPDSSRYTFMTASDT